MKVRRNPGAVKRVGVLGTGTIGAGWAVHFLRMGMDVVAYDPVPAARDLLRTMVDKKWPVMVRLGLVSGATPARLIIAESMQEMASNVDVIQESTPEDLESKQATFSELDTMTPKHVVIISSTSGLPMTAMQERCNNPQRFVIGHPFNPPYLIPFCEVIGGEKTDQAVVDWTTEFYKSIGKKVVQMTTEVPGFIANRLQEAMWREALHMVANGDCSLEDIDTSIAYGPGLRWAIMGPGLTYHLAGGEKGIAYTMEHFSPEVSDAWSHLKYPEITDKLKKEIVKSCSNMADKRSTIELGEERDECLLGIIKVLDECRKQNA
jgi:carnitine 3-dehydrogenase